MTTPTHPTKLDTYLSELATSRKRAAIIFLIVGFFLTAAFLLEVINVGLLQVLTIITGVLAILAFLLATYFFRLASSTFDTDLSVLEVEDPITSTINLEDIAAAELEATLQTGSDSTDGTDKADTTKKD